tara:strand:+ start:148 stop:537 length:390 start_codon:yes stop_codon:yes gene_type:complete
MKINIKSKSSWDAIKLAQGNAKVHCFHFIEWDSMGSIAEKAINAINLPLSHRQGAIVHIRSGGRIPMAYKWKRVVSSVTLQRGKNSWFLIECHTSDTSCRKAGGTFIALKQKQANYLVNKLKENFSIQS